MEDNQLQVDMPKKEKPTKKIMVIGIAIILVIALASTMLFAKSPKTLFFAAISNSMKKLEKEKNEWLASDEGALITYLSQNPAHITYDISANLNSDLFGESDQVWLDFVHNSKLSVDTYTDAANDKSISTIALKNQGSQLIDMTILQLGTKAGIKIPLLYPKYFYFDTQEIGEAMRTIDPDAQGIEKLPNWKEKSKTFEQLSKKGEPIEKEYAKFIFNHIEDTNISMEKDSSATINGIDVKGKKITLTLSEEELKSLLTALIEKAQQDDALQQYITEYALEVNDILVGMDPTVGKLEASEVTTQTKEALSTAKEELQKISLPEGVKISLLVGAKNTVVDTSMKFAIKDTETNETVSVTLNISDYKKQDQSRHRALNVALNSQELTAEVQGQWDTMWDKNRENNEFLVTVKENNNPMANFKLTADKTKNDKITMTTADYTLAVGEGAQISGTYTCDTVGSVKTKQVDNDMTLSVRANSYGENIQAQLNVKESIELGKTYNWSEFTPDNSVDIVRMTEEEMIEIQNEVQGAIMGLVFQLMPLF